MADGVIPESQRLAKQTDALVKGAWTEIVRLTDWLHDLEDRIVHIERHLGMGKNKITIRREDT